MTYTAEELVQNVVGAFLRRHKGEFFCVGCLGKQARTELGPSFTSVQTQRAIDAMFRSARGRTGLFQPMPSWPCSGHGGPDQCIGIPAERA